MDGKDVLTGGREFGGGGPGEAGHGEIVEMREDEGIGGFPDG